MKITAVKTLLLGLLTITVALSVGWLLATRTGHGNGLTASRWLRHGTVPGDSDRQLKRLTDTLELSREQQQKIRPILQYLDAKTAEVKGDRTASSQERLIRMKQLRAESSRQIWDVLTEEQKKKAIQLKQSPKRMNDGGDRDRAA